MTTLLPFQGSNTVVPVASENAENTDLDAHRLGGDIELLLSCTDLPNLDLFSKSDPMCVLFTKQFGQWREIWRTEAVKDCLDPKVRHHCPKKSTIHQV